MADVNEEFDKWLDEKWLLDMTEGEDWTSLILAMREAYTAGWEDAKERYNETH